MVAIFKLSPIVAIVASSITGIIYCRNMDFGENDI